MTALATGLRDTARWIQSRDPLATNYLYCLQAADQASALFDILDALKPHFPLIAGGYARGTNGVDLPFVLDVIRAGRAT